MLNVYILADVKQRRHAAIANTLSLALDPVFRRLDAISGMCGSPQPTSVWPLSADACIAMVVDEAQKLRPCLRTAGVERTIMWQVLAELRLAFEENATNCG